jgi:predicted metal-dependent TIM-barrel fold hydrolase
VLGRGYYAGITVSRSKSTVEDAVRMIRQHRHDAHRIMINSDAMTAGPEEYQMFLDVWEYLDEETMAVAGETAKSFFGL